MLHISMSNRSYTILMTIAHPSAQEGWLKAPRPSDRVEGAHLPPPLSDLPEALSSWRPIYMCIHVQIHIYIYIYI